MHWKKCFSWQRVNQGARVVKNLIKKIENSSRNITCNNFFTSVPFARELPQTKCTLAENIKKNKPKLPQPFTVAISREITSTVFELCNHCIFVQSLYLFEFQKDTMIAPYCSKNGCVFNQLSTMHLLFKMLQILPRKSLK